MTETLDNKIKVLARSIAGLYQNQQVLDNAFRSLATSERGLDYQVAVLTRTTVMNLNKVRALVGLDYITKEELDAVFSEWSQFVQRKDRNEQMEHWVLGRPLEDLPPEPEVEEENSSAEAAPQEEEPAPGEDSEPIIFGGDYGDTDDGEETPEQDRLEDETLVEDNEVPSLRPSDEAESHEGEDTAEVHKVPA